MRTVVYENWNGIMAAIDCNTGEYLAGGPRHSDISPEEIRATLEALGVQRVLYYIGAKGIWRNPLLPVDVCFPELRRRAKQAQPGGIAWTLIPIEWIGDGESIYHRVTA